MLIWSPLLATVLFSAIIFVQVGMFHFDYLTPAIGLF
jgi:hypothetical protein